LLLLVVVVVEVVVTTAAAAVAVVVAVVVVNYQEWRPSKEIIQKYIYNVIVYYPRYSASR
jgi:hypothetical protein